MKRDFSTTKPKLLVVIGTLAHMGGAERQALYLVEHLSKLSEYDVEVLAFEEGNSLRPLLQELGVKTHVFSYYFRWPKAKRTQALGKLAYLLRNRIKPDALLPFVGIHSKTIALVWPYSGARFCWWNQQDEGRDLTGTQVEGRILRKVSSILSNSVAGQDFLAQTYGLDPADILVYNNGTPVPKNPPAAGAWRNRESLGDRQIVTMLANVTAFKDHATLLDAWKLVRDDLSHSPPPILLLAGHLRERETVTALKLRAFELGLSSSDVRFLGPVDDVLELLADSDLVVHSSLTEGCPNAVCEAMAMRRAVVATDIPGTRQALGEDGRQWLAAPRDARDLASKMITMLTDGNARDMAGEANLTRIVSAFSISGMNQFFISQIKRGLDPSVS